MKQKRHKVLHNWLFWVFLVTFIAIFLRSIPAWTNTAWGCDFGIYYGLTNSVVEQKELFNPYNGWGGSYQYFPVLYGVTAVAHWISGLDVLYIMPKLAPIFGGLSILIFYFLVYELIGNKKVALLSSLFLAVMPFHVYQTSHASPLTMGHFFLMLSLYLFVKYRKNTKYIFPLAASTVLLTMSHHLTTYFYIIALIFIIFIENASKKEWTPSIKKDVFYILCASGFVFSYWMVIAKPVFAGFMNIGYSLGGIRFGSSAILILFYLGFFSMFGVIYLKRRLSFFIEKKEPTSKSCFVKFTVTVLIILAAMSVFTIIKMPWTNFSFPPISILYALPLVIMIGFGVAGFRFMRFIPNGCFIKGWLLALIFSFFYGLFTNSEIILPDRHIEYLMAPVSILAFYGLKGIFSNVSFDSLPWLNERSFHPFSYIQSKKQRLIHKRQIFYIVIVLALVTTNAISTYPSFVALNVSDEEISQEDMSAIEWMKTHLDTNTSVIASDHRLARIAEAVGFNTTLDEASNIWEKENLTDYIAELDGIGKNYSRITHVVIDDIMREHVVHVHYGNSIYMINASYDKFSSQPFELVYRNVTLNNEGFEVHWAEVYEINWVYINEKSLYL
ncbi:MAG: glycosyltransferase family 39 protein [Euryarchaeota archaeon]|nr:glycosyltransferase family 39 protein [Euryarchaeota archaeon]